MVYTRRVSEPPPTTSVRAIRAQLSRHKDTLAWLWSARRALKKLGYPTSNIDSDIERVAARIGHLNSLAGGHVEPRKKPRFDETPQHQSQRKSYLVFLDESGVRAPKPQEQFDVFVVAAAVVERTYFDRVLVSEVRRLKDAFFGEEKVTFHEPAVRQHKGVFYFEGDLARQREFCASYQDFLRGVDVTFVAAVLDRRRLAAEFGGEPIDEFLPRSNYALAYDFVLERVCNLLYSECDDGIGAIFPERVGKREDAELQLEHARLVTEGTRFVSQRWFQNQFKPGLHFYRKGEHFGIELADVMARTVADHYNIGDEAACWDVLRHKLFCGHMDRIDPGNRWGSYKVFPGRSEE